MKIQVEEQFGRPLIPRMTNKTLDTLLSGALLCHVKQAI